MVPCEINTTTVRNFAFLVNSGGEYWPKWVLIEVKDVMHGGNRPAWDWVIALVAKIKPGLRFQLTAWWLEPEVKALARQHFGRVEGHAGLEETAGALVSDPTLVRLEAASATPDQGLTRRENAQEFRESYPHGVIGARPGEATAAFGEEMIEGLVVRYTRLLETRP